MSKKVLDVQGVNKSFCGFKALNEVVFDAVEGETHAIIGPNRAVNQLSKCLYWQADP
jgi:ABC-type branched-subunit amino acid transport system ATPase component